MNSIIKSVVLSVAVAASTLATLPAAQAGEGQWRRHYHGYHGSNGGDLAAAGILGLAAGALIVGLTTQPAYREPAYGAYQPNRRYPAAYDSYAQGGYAATLEPWTADWYDYCAGRYRSFKPRTGTFTGYDGQQHFCVAD